jgi:hypothetical protein
MKALFCLCLLGCTVPAFAQAPPSYANYSIMLVNSAPGGGAVVLMHTPSNGLEFVPVGNTKTAMDAGDVPVRAAELGEFIAAMKEENARLIAENSQLKGAGTPVAAPTQPSQADIEAQQEAQAAAEKAARRRQMIQAWMMLQNMNRPQTFNLNVTDCSRFPGACAGR